MQKKYILFIVILFFASMGVSFFIFEKISPKPVIVQTVRKASNGQALMFDDSLPKTQPCPLNGVKYSTQQEQWWQKHRPLGVMIENHIDARPQSGLSFADLVYEAVAEGGITRFAAIYYCQDAPTVGPVRSARTYFVDFVSEFGKYPLYAHVGGANAAGPADALGQITSYGWDGYNDLNQFYLGFPTYWRDYDRLGHTVATEHTMYSTTSKLWKVGEDHKLTNVDEKGTPWDENFVKYTFKDDVGISARPSSQTIHLEFWKGVDDYAVDWIYDPVANAYKRNNAGKPHIDLDTKKQLTTKNLVILYMKEVSANDGYEDGVHRLYQNKGTGKATIFMDGKQIKGTWKKDSRETRTLLFDANGNTIEFNRGQIWFTVMPLDGILNVQ